MARRESFSLDGLAFGQLRLASVDGSSSWLQAARSRLKLGWTLAFPWSTAVPWAWTPSGDRTWWALLLLIHRAQRSCPGGCGAERFLLCSPQPGWWGCSLPCLAHQGGAAAPRSADRRRSEVAPSGCGQPATSAWETWELLRWGPVQLGPLAARALGRSPPLSRSWASTAHPAVST